MKEKAKRKGIVIIIHILFWAIVCYFFYTNSILRPFASNAVYKEFLTVLFIAIMVYVNYLYLIPRYVNSFKYKEYFIFALLTVLAAGIGEFFLLKPDIIDCYPDTLSPDILNHILRTGAIFLMLRDFCFLLFFFVIRLYQNELKDHISDKIATSQETHTITIKQTYGDSKVLNIRDIVYLSHRKNVVYFHLTNSESYSQYSTLTLTMRTLPKEYFARINRGNIIMFEYVICWNESLIRLDLSQNGNYIELPISLNYQNEVINKMQMHTPATYNKKMNNGGEKFQGGGEKMMKNAYLAEKMAEKINPFSQEIMQNEVFLYILNHPGCNVPEINEGINKSVRSIERQLKELKEGGIIEFKGPFKNGGYYVIELKTTN